MKFHVDVECTPEEARRALGLPDVSPVNDAFVEEMKRRMTAAMASMDPEQLMKTWGGGSIQGFEQLQRMFWDQMTRAGRSG